ncbi:UNVERIFIED_CONTAM: hypothetical protein Sangu_2996300 [Sesamum angustifolium]|uniref:Uncharacterized protein n=1 Tax=Sesamum angustifolium TaxID=2727405 RepID=A0AAW2KQK6_9LAMI
MWGGGGGVLAGIATADDENWVVGSGRNVEAEERGEEGYFCTNRKWMDRGRSGCPMILRRPGWWWWCGGGGGGALAAVRVGSRYSGVGGSITNADQWPNHNTKGLNTWAFLKTEEQKWVSIPYSFNFILSLSIYAWIGCNSAKFGHLYAAAPTPPSNTVGVTSLIGGASDNIGSGIARRLVLKTGLNVVLACNIPKNSPILEANAEKILVQKLISLGYTKPKI